MFAFLLVVSFDKRLVGVSRYKQIGTEGVDPERVLERIPSGVFRAAVRDRENRCDLGYGPTRHDGSLGSADTHAVQGSFRNTGPAERRSDGAPSKALADD
jgi:hypothetical protein